MSYIYKITNTYNNKAYIGKTDHSNPINRWKEHLRDCRKETEQKRPLYSAINKYGVEAFTFEVLEETSQPSEREVYYIEYYKTFTNGYNATKGGDGTSKINKDEIISYYLKHNPTMKELALQLKLDQKTCRKVLKEHGIVHTKKIENLYKSVTQLTLDGVPVQTFTSISEAAKTLGDIKYTTNISRCCRGLRQTTLGFKWKYN